MSRSGPFKVTPYVQAISSTPSANQLSGSDYQYFWTELKRRPAGPTRFVADLVVKVVDVVRQAKKYEKQGRDVERILSALAHTIRYADLFHEIDPNHMQFAKAVRAFEEFHKTEPLNTTSGESRVKNALKALLSQRVHKNEMVDALVIECVFVDDVQNSLFVSSSDAAKDESNGDETSKAFGVLADDAFVFLSLWDKMLRGGSGARKVFMAVLKVLGAAPSQIRASPNLTRTMLRNVLSILHLLRVLLHSYPISDQRLLMEAKKVVEVFCDWPKAYGDVAREIVRTLKDEIERPGRSRLLAVLRDNPMLTEFGTDVYDESGFRAIEWARKRRTVTVAYDAVQGRARAIRPFIESQVPKGTAFSKEALEIRRSAIRSLVAAHVQFEKSTDPATVQLGVRVFYV